MYNFRKLKILNIFYFIDIKEINFYFQINADNLNENGNKHTVLNEMKYTIILLL